MKIFPKKIFAVNFKSCDFYKDLSINFVPQIQLDPSSIKLLFILINSVYWIYDPVLQEIYTNENFSDEIK